MAKDLFDLDSALLNNPQNNYEDNLRHAKALCIRGQYDRALAIYNEILDKDYENEDALIGVLRVHSHDFTIFDSDEIKQDIHAIKAMCPNTTNEDYLNYLKKKKDSEVIIVEEVSPNDDEEEIIIYVETPEFKEALKKGKKFCSTKNWKRCKELLEPFYEDYAHHTELNYLLGFADMAKKKHKEAIAHFEDCLKHVDESYRYYYKIHYLLGCLYSQMHQSLSQMKKSIINISKAKDHFLIAKQGKDKFVNQYPIECYINYVEDIERFPKLLEFLNMGAWDIKDSKQKDFSIKIANSLIKEGCPYGYYYLAIAQYYASNQDNTYYDLLFKCINNVIDNKYNIIGVDALQTYINHYEKSTYNPNPPAKTKEYHKYKPIYDQLRSEYGKWWDNWEE